MAKHKAMVALELEVLAKKFDRFGWERDTAKDCPAQARMITDWMDALQDYPLNEVQAACRAAVISNPNKMPNEGHVVAEIMKARKKAVAHLPKPPVEQPRAKDPDRKSGDEIMREIGFTPKKFGGGE